MHASNPMRRLKAMLTLSSILATGAVVPALAQPAAPPVYKSLDDNGVDLHSGGLVLSLASISIGQGPGGVSYNWATSQAAQTDAIGYVIEDLYTAGTRTFTVVIGSDTETFDTSGTLGSAPFTQKQGRGSTLVYNSSTGVYTYTGSDGTVATFGKSISGGNTPSSYPLILTLTYPTGESLTYYYRQNPSTSFPSYGLKSIASSIGYQLRVTGSFDATGVYYPSRIDAFNMLSETCDPAAASCTLAGTWPSLAINAANTQATDATGRSVTAAMNGSGQYVVTYPSGKTNTYSFSSGRVSSVSDGRGTWTYDYPLPVGVATIVKEPGDTVGRIYQFRTSDGLILNDTANPGGVGGGIAYGYDSNGRMTSLTQDGRVTEYTYDGRGNITETRHKSRTPGTPADIVVSSSYPATCSNQKICNKPSYTIDALGQTDFTYDPASGGLLTVTQPPAPSGVRPQKRYSYTALQANYRDGSGSIVQGAPAYRLTATSECQTLSNCAGTADEVKTVIGYGADDALLPTSATTGAGDGSLSVSTTTSYTGIGRVKTVDGPLAGADDTTRTYYDAMGRIIGEIGADPDGAGGLPRQASRTSYDTDGDPSLLETGTATDVSDSGMSTFSALQSVTTKYDITGRPITMQKAAAGTIYSAQETSYTAAGRVQCSAVRMDPSTFPYLTGNACSIGVSSVYGPDRITSNTYDAGGRLTKVQANPDGTGTLIDQRTITYTATNKVETVSDANGNKTTYSYDGFDRLSKTAYPSTSSPGTSSTTDFDELTYNAASAVQTHRGRDGRTLTYQYDNLGRLTGKIVPDNCVSGYSCITPPSWAVRDVYFSHDLLGRQLSARFDSASGSDAVTATYDALGRAKTNTTSMDGISRTLSYNYAPNDMREDIYYPDGNSIHYYRYTNGNIYYTVANGAPLFHTPLDSAGRLSIFYRYDGSSWNIPTVYGYDSMSRPNVVTDYFAGGANLQTSFTYNPADQVVSRTLSNTAFAFAHQNANRPYATNGLNQYAAAGSASFTHDSNGNLSSTTDPLSSTTYTYDPENRLVATSAGVTLRYDPLGRLYETYSPSTGVKRFLYDGTDLVAEYDSAGNMLGRYVHGDSADSPLVWYDGASMSSPRYLMSDQVGSITAVTDSAGNVIRANTYDEYGIPGATNLGRFQYTGQTWIPELGMYYYKARIYSPTLGRFMQADPIGYGDGMNMYAYVHNDPVNSRDPSGMVDPPGGDHIYVFGHPPENEACGGPQTGPCLSDPWQGVMGYQTAPTGQPATPGSQGPCVITSGLPTTCPRPLPKQKSWVRKVVRRYICDKLANNYYNISGAFNAAYDQRNRLVNGVKVDVANSVYREGENFLFAARDKVHPIVTTGYGLMKIVSPLFGDETGPSFRAWAAGVEGSYHYGWTTKQWKQWCAAE